MGIIENKQDIFGNIAALRTLNEGFPNLNIFNSIPSINNEKNSLDFLTDLLKSLVGFEEIKTVLVDTLTYELSNIETDIKKSIKKEIKGFINCGFDPSIPDFLQKGSVNNVVELELRKIDINDIFLIDPSSDLGPMFYSDISSGLNSTDFNTFLQNTIQTPGVTNSWGATNYGSDMIDVTFLENSIPNNNVIQITASNGYSNGNKTLTELNNNFIDSINLFNVKELIPNMLDSIFGSISLEINKTSKQIEKEVIFEEIINKILNTDDDDIIDDSYFSFDLETEKLLEKRVSERLEGKKIINTNKPVTSTVPVNDIISFSNQLNTITNTVDKRQSILDNIDSLSDSSAANVNTKDKYNVKLNFVDALLKKLMLSIANVVFGPKMIMLYAWNHKIVHGIDSDFSDPLTFMKQNKTFIKTVLKSIRDAVITVLLKEVLTRITELVTKNIQTILTEKVKNNQAQIASLIGIPQEVIRTIQNLN